MQPFSLKEYLVNPNKKLITKDGRKAKIIYTNAKGKCPIIALVKSENNLCESPRSYTADGICFPINEQSDLFFAGEKHEGWINIFKNISSGNYYMGDSRVFKSKEDAEKEGMKCIDYISTIKIEWEE